MKVNKKLKAGIGIISFLIIAFYTFCQLFYGTEYLNGVRYGVQAIITILFLIPLFFSFKYVLPKNKSAAVLLAVVDVFLMFYAICDILGKNFWLTVEIFCTSLWPLFCYWLAQKVDVGRKLGKNALIIDWVIYNGVIALFIWLLKEVFFSYMYFGADVTEEIYMFIMAVVAFLLVNIKEKNVSLSKWNIICFAAINIAIGVVWFFYQERMAEIISSLNYEKSQTDAEGDLMNWLSHRALMLKTSISGNFALLSNYWKYPVIAGCPIVWLSSVGGLYIAITVAALTVAAITLMVLYARKSNNVLISVLTVSFLVKSVFAIFTNLFLISSTSIGIPFVKTAYDIIPLAIMLLFVKVKNISPTD